VLPIALARSPTLTHTLFFGHEFFDTSFKWFLHPLGRKQGDSQIRRLMHQPDRFARSKVSPPTGGNRPQTKTDLADCEIGVFVSSKMQETYLTTLSAEVTEKNYFSVSVSLLLCLGK
jgi:hypothetical protein